VRHDIEVAKLASERAAAIVLWKMGRGRASLAAIASSAALIGLLGTLGAFRDSLGGMSAEGTPITAIMAGGLAEATMPTAVGLFVTIVASWCHGYLCTQLEALDTEMQAATLEMANALSLRQRN
jgi:biopolymer transport protein ExbB/TolQ